MILPLYDDECGHACYDEDDDHVDHDTQGSADLQISLRTASSTMMDPGGCEPLGDSHSHV